MNFLLFALVGVAIAWIQCWTGGTRLAFSLPASALIALAALLSLPGVRRKDNPAWISCLAISSMLFAYLVFRAAHSPVDYLWWPDYYSLVAGMTAYLLIALYLTGPAERSWMLIVFLAIALGECLVGLEQFVKDDNFMLFGFVRPVMGPRASGFFVGPNALAGYLEAVGIFGLSLACWSRWPGWARGVMGYLSAVCYFGIAISGSRGGYLSSLLSLLVFGCLSLWAVRRMAPHRLTGTFLAGALAVSILFIVVGTMMGGSFLTENRLGTLGKAIGERSADTRTYNWEAAIDQYHRSPIFGTGAGTYLFFGRLFRRAPLQADPVHAHSDYLELLAEYGIIGLVGAAVFLAVHVAGGLRAIAGLTRTEWASPFTEKTNALAIQIGSLSAVAALTLHSAFDFNLHIPGNALVFAVIFGMLGGSRPAGAANEPQDMEITFFRLLLPGLGLWMCASGVPKIPGETFAERARVALRDRSFQKSIELGNKALAYEKRNPEIYFNLGEANRGLARELPYAPLRQPFLRTAEAAYRSGIAIFPTDENLWLRLGQALDGLGEFQEATNAYRKALALDPKLGVLHAYYAAHLRAAGREAEAAEELDKGGSLARRDLTAVVQDALRDPLSPVAPRKQ